MEVKIKGIYKHFKGDYYIVEEIGFDSETEEKVVIYRGLYEGGKLWVRPYDNFVGKTKDNKSRFEYISVLSVR